MDDETEDELRRRFEEAVSGPELRHLRLLPGGAGASRPDMRRVPLAAPAVFRVRVELRHSRPTIWRLLDLRSDLTLDRVHEVLQAAFGWQDGHLHRFALGGGPFDQGSQLFLCPYDVEDGEEDGLPAADVRLDEVLQDPSDELDYVYDYGDDWGLVLRLDEVRSAGPDTRWATCVAGERAAPPEDCGGLTEAEELAEVLEDPAAFDVDEVNHALGSAFSVLAEVLDPRLLELVDRLRFSPVGTDLVARLVELALAAPEPDEVAMREALAAPLWFVESAAEPDGMELTGAGYLKPADVVAACEIVPGARDWWGKNNREVHVGPLLSFREVLQSIGLLRKRKGRLLATRAALATRADVSLLWRHLAGRLVPEGSDDFQVEAALLLLVYAATAGAEDSPSRLAVEALGHLGWRRTTGPLEYYEMYRLPAYVVLTNVDDRDAGRRRLWERDRFSGPAAALARAALRR